MHPVTFSLLLYQRDIRVVDTLFKIDAPNSKLSALKLGHCSGSESGFKNSVGNKKSDY
jgi:hypothetical protein